jgi:predicted dehydrogenase
MGAVHSQAWRTVAPVFEPGRVELAGVVARDAVTTARFADRWGWACSGTDLAEMLERTDADLVDVASPNHLHRPHVETALAAGCHVVCEKPLASTLADASAMAEAARSSGRHASVWFNYRRTPALALAHRLVADRRLGEIRQVRAAYLQSWGTTAAHTWRFESALAGSGAHGDIASHSVDLARFVSGRDVVEVVGSLQHRFVPSRRAVDGREVPSDVDDVSMFLARLEGGATASYEASRVASGHLCANRLEVHGELGAVRFDFEDMNRLGWFDGTDEGAVQGWRTIHVTRGQHGHPYAERWWPEGHGLGYEHTFVHHAADVLTAIAGRQPSIPLPTFDDAVVNQRVLEAATQAARQGRAVAVTADA